MIRTACAHIGMLRIFIYIFSLRTKLNLLSIRSGSSEHPTEHHVEWHQADRTGTTRGGEYTRGHDKFMYPEMKKIAQWGCGGLPFLESF